MLRFTGALLLAASFVFAGFIVETIDFSTAQLTFARQGEYDLITMPGCFTTVEKGKPILPVKSLGYLIPPTAEITGIEVLSFRTSDLPGTYRPYPGQRFRSTAATGPAPFIEPDPGVYGSNRPYPDKIADFVKSGCLSGYRIAGINVYPLQYLPEKQALRLYTSVTFKIIYEENRFAEPVSLTRRQLELFGADVGALVENPDRIKSWGPATRDLRATEVDMVIITGPALVASWNALKNWKTKKGINTEIIRTDSIYASCPGRDQQEKIRNFIRSYWQNKGLKYVLLGGDDFVVPDRKTTLVVEESTITDNLPTDMYYADLQWSWDGNHNDVFGEMEDTVDLFHDLFIGRAPVDNAANIGTFTRKDTTFEKRADTTYLKSVLLPSEMLWDPYHGRYGNNVIATFFPGGWKISKLEDPNPGVTFDSLNRGYEFCHVAAHGNYNTYSVLDIDEVRYFTNGAKYNVISGINCNVGQFDGGDCIAESLVNFAGGACLAAFANARFGLGYPPAFGPSDIVDFEIYRGFNVSGIRMLGAMHANAKNHCRSMAMSQAPTRWVVYEYTLFGDPTLAMYSSKPAVLAVTHAASIAAGPQVIRIAVLASGSPLAGALVCAMKGTEVYSRGRTNASGWIDLFVNPTPGTMDITVTADNCRPYEGACAVTAAGAPKPCLTYWSCTVNDAGGNNNGRLDPGETVDMTVKVKNSGNAAATGVTGRLRTASAYITRIDSTSSYGNIPAGDTAAGDAYRLTVSGSAPPGTPVEFTVFAQAPEGTWEPFFEKTIGVAAEPRTLWADHDTGSCVLSVTSFGSCGTTYLHGEGSGFKYSKLASNGSLYYGSMVCGTGPTYIVDRFYGHPSSGVNQDFRIRDTLRAVIPPRIAHEEYEAVYSDSGHATPRGLIVKQWSLMTSLPGYDDGVIICFDYTNRGAAPINNFYSGLMLDFDVYNVQDNNVFSDSARRFVYTQRSTLEPYPTVGVRLLKPTVARNLSAIDHLYYVEPGSMMTEAVKDSFLKGLIRLPASTRTDNYSACVSAGPFDLAPSGGVRVVYAIVGGNDAALARQHSDSLQSWWDNAPFVGEDASLSLPAAAFPEIEPNPARGRFAISYDLPVKEDVAVFLYDAGGRQRAVLYRGELAGRGSLEYSPRGLAAGVYFVKIERTGSVEVKKVVFMR